MIKIFLLTIILFFKIEALAAEEIPLPPVSPKQEASVQREKAKLPPQIATEEPIAITSKTTQQTDQAIKRLVLGVVSAGDLYLPLANSLCLNMNQANSKNCRLKEYQDNTQAVKGLIGGEVDILITNSLIVKVVMKEIPPFNNKIDKTRIRFLNYFFSEALLLFAKREDSLQYLNDLQTRSINFSSKSIEKIFNTIRTSKGWTNPVSDTFVSQKEQVLALCNNDSIKVASFLVEIFNQEVKNITRACQVNLIKFSREEINQITKEMGFFPYKVAGGLYLGLPEATETISTKALALTTSDLTDGQATFFLENLLKNLPALQKLDVALEEVTREVLFTGPLLQEHQAVAAIKDKSLTSEEKNLSTR
jgi:TRAP-type uncharacterized transport system substrate-binding protein